MKDIAVVESLLNRDDGGELNRHIPPHGTSNLTGEIVSGGNDIIKINGKSIVRVGDSFPAHHGTLTVMTGESI